MQATKEIKARMLLLRAEAETALAAIPKDKWHEQGAVNWGDIGVCDVRWWVSDYEHEGKEESGFTVTLEEASPGSKLAVTIWEAMGKPEDVEVVCEW